jgi:hypothetical protein
MYLSILVEEKNKEIEFVKNQLDEQKNLTKTYQDMVFSYLGLNELKQVEVQRKDLSNLKGVKLGGGHTWAARKVYLENAFKLPKDKPEPVTYDKDNVPEPPRD